MDTQLLAAVRLSAGRELESVSIAEIIATAMAHERRARPRLRRRAPTLWTCGFLPLPGMDGEHLIKDPRAVEIADTHSSKRWTEFVRAASGDVVSLCNDGPCGPVFPRA
jgi:hypothetical protein